MRILKFEYHKVSAWGILGPSEDYVLSNLKETEKIRTFEDVIDYFSGKSAARLTDHISLNDIKLAAPVLPTKNVLCIGKNYHDHILEFDGSAEDIANVKENPIFFTKAVSSVIGTDSVIDLHAEATSEVDYEAELAVVIGKKCLNVSKLEAMDYVYGYTCLNDVTARDLQRTHQQWSRGKSLDTFCPIGPWIVTADEIDTPQNLTIRSIINGEFRQDANTSVMIHDIASQISVLSTGMTLNPGDIIATGTPKGVGMGYKPERLLEPGDEVEIWIEGIGSLINICR